jgi:hypothetical protein
LQPFISSIAALPVYQRVDAQQVRYIAPSARDTDGYLPFDVVLLLAREPGSPARFEPVAPLDALCAILDSGYSKAHAVDAQTVVGLAENMARCASFRFVYDDLAGAITAIESRLHA